MRRKARFVAMISGMSEYDAGVLTADVDDAASYFEAVAKGQRWQTGRQLGHQRVVRTAQEG